MKRMSFLSMGAAALLLTCAACTDDIAEVQSGTLKQIVMTASDFETEDESRTSFKITNAGAEFSWAANDTVGIFPDEGAQAYFPMTSGAGTKSANFTGGGWALKDASTYAAYYPFVGDFYLNKNAIPVHYDGQVQSGDASTAHLGAYDYMVAAPSNPKNGNVNFAFKHLGALVQLKLTVPRPATLKSVTLTTGSNSFAIKGKVNVMASTPGITSTSTAKEITLGLENVATTEANQVVTLYLMVPPADLSTQTLKAVVKTNYGSEEVALSSKNFLAGKAYALNGSLEDSEAAGIAGGTVKIETAGTLRTLLGDNYLKIGSLKIVGPINGDDVYYLRRMLGASEFGEADKGKLTTLDLSEVTIVEGGEYYCYAEDFSGTSEYYYTSDNTIGAFMFYQCANLTSIAIPNSVTECGKYAFFNCSNLTSVHISDLTAWCKIKFNNFLGNPLCYRAKLLLNGKEITELVIPEDISEIKDYAFSGSTIKKVTIHDNVTSIGERAFYECEALASVTIPNSVTSIGYAAFCRCKALASVTIPNSVTSIGYATFDECEALASVTIPNSVTSIGSEAFSRCEALTSMTIPNSVTSIGSGAFSECRALTSITIPNSVTSIGNHAFWDCDALTSIIIPDSVTSIEEATFWDCDALTSITIPNSVTSIGGSAFCDCDALTSVTVGNGLKKIHARAFRECDALTDFYCNATIVPELTSNNNGSDDSFDIKNEKTLYVPIRCVSKYKSTKVGHKVRTWSYYFTTIREME